MLDRMRRDPAARPAAALLLLLVPLLAGACAGGAPRGDALLRDGDPTAAVAALREEEAARPDDVLVKRNLGVALFMGGEAEAAAAKLSEAAALHPDDTVTQYFLGRAAEASRDDDTALRAYGRYLALTDRGRGVILTRMRALAEERARRDMADALARESAIEAASLPPSTVAVPSYANITANEDLAPLARGLAVVLITDLAAVEELRVVERERLNVLAEEVALGIRPAAGAPADAGAPPPVTTTEGMKFRLRALERPGTASPYYAGPVNDARDDAFRTAVRAFQSDRGLTVDGVPGPRTQEAIETAWRSRPADAPPPTPPSVTVDPSSAARAGKLLGAGTLVLGSFAVTGTEELELAASVVTVADGAHRAAGAPVGGPREEVLVAQKRLTFAILEALGVRATNEERRRIEAVPTRNFGAFLAWCRGLDFEARGMGDAARDAYREALRLDPGFGLAQDELDVGSAEPGAEDALRGETLEDAVRGGGEDPLLRLVRTGGWFGLGPGPDLDRGGELDPSVTPAETIEEGRIVVEGDLPRGGKP